MHADLGCGGGDFGRAELSGDVEAIEQDAIAIETRFEPHVRGVREEIERGGIVGGDAGFDRFQGEGAVHRAAFEVEQAEALGEGAGDGALPCSGGTIDGYDERRSCNGHLAFVPLTTRFALWRAEASGWFPTGTLSTGLEAA